MNFGRGNAQKRPGECEKATVNKELDDIELHPKRALRGRMPTYKNMRPDWHETKISRPARGYGHYLVWDGTTIAIAKFQETTDWETKRVTGWEWSAPEWTYCTGYDDCGPAELYFIDDITHWAELPEPPSWE
jgi:hypothetical protein